MVVEAGRGGGGVSRTPSGNRSHPLSGCARAVQPCTRTARARVSHLAACSGVTRRSRVAAQADCKRSRSCAWPGERPATTAHGLICVYPTAGAPEQLVAWLRGNVCGTGCGRGQQHCTAEQGGQPAWGSDTCAAWHGVGRVRRQEDCWGGGGRECYLSSTQLRASMGRGPRSGYGRTPGRS